MSEVAFSFDIETNGLHDATLVHCIAIQCIHTKQEFLCADQPGYLPISLGLELLSNADFLIGHNARDYDVPVLERLYPSFTVPRSKVIDTYLLARTMFPAMLAPDRLIEGMPKELRGKHKLEAWGWRVGMAKGSFGKSTDWKTFSPEMADYCMQDVRLTTVLHELLMLAVMEDEREAA